MLNSLLSLSWIPITQYRQLKSFKRGIYAIRNNITQKFYVGMTHGSIYNRIRGHLYVAQHKQNNQFAIYKTLRKHSLDSFDVAIVELVDESISLQEREQYYISLYDSFHNGYNMTIGGEGWTGNLHTPETKSLISSKRKNVPCPEILKQKLHKPVLQLDIKTNEFINRFDSISDAQKATHISNIGMCCKNKIKSAGGYVWRFENLEHLDTVNWSNESKKRNAKKWDSFRKRNEKSVCQLDIKTNEIIKIFPSAKIAHQETNIKNIDLCARGGRKSAGGFHWKYNEDLCVHIASNSI
jgi:group I intron endonuclease